MSADNPYRQIFELLDACYGPQNWWPADNPFEVMVGAVLVQNTAWSNASKAIDRLRDNGMLSLPSILAAPEADIAQTIVSCGYYNIKAKRLKSLCQWLQERGGIDAIRGRALGPLRTDLLSVHGIGRETADDILLYALGRPVFVIDAYTRRVFSRIGLADRNAGYEVLRETFESMLGEDVLLFNQYHALIVHHAKYVCQKQPECSECCLRQQCGHAIIKPE